ncbi:hypothetical protein [Paractinoplanes ferrugineus]|nr:hypothetical protein [Actinoplanes ferrugineus]
MNSTDDLGGGVAGLAARTGWARHPGVRTGPRLELADRAADALCRVLGSWTWLIAASVTILAAGTMTLRHDHAVGGAARLAVALSVLAVLQVSALLRAIRRADRIAAEVALYHLDQARRAAAVAEDLRDELARLHTDVARIAAHLDIAAQPVRHR